ncbi:hypothetical protein ABT001_06545 [Streptomyces sp. NPDC002793]|uniref:hypothetical protein n=1 Tax=Streptomyces sp. NPDC002793 TaxID=3154432 RepID=UPI00332D4998
MTFVAVGTDDDRNAVYSSGSSPVWQDTRTFPDDDGQNSAPAPSASPMAKSYAMGEKAKSGSVTVVVKEVRESETAAIDKYGEARTLKAGAGAKYVVVETIVYNDGADSFDPVCGGGISQGLIDTDGRTFDAIADQHLFKGNDEACTGEETQPGFKQDAVFVYKLPAQTSPAQWTFSGTRGATEDGLASVEITSTTAS